MIKFLAHGKKGQTIIGLGLSEGNIQRMKQGDPIYFSLEELGIEGYDVTIVYGETEDAIKKDFKKHGVTFGKEVDL
jgi:hypothetical protein